MAHICFTVPRMCAFNKDDTAGIWLFWLSINNLTGLIASLLSATFLDTKAFKKQDCPPFSNSPQDVIYCKVKECSIWSARLILNRASLWAPISNGLISIVICSLSLQGETPGPAGRRDNIVSPAESRPSYGVSICWRRHTQIGRIQWLKSSPIIAPPFWYYPTTTHEHTPSLDSLLEFASVFRVGDENYSSPNYTQIASTTRQNKWGTTVPASQPAGVRQRPLFTSRRYQSHRLSSHRTEAPPRWRELAFPLLSISLN